MANAVQSARIVERVIKSDKPRKEAHKRTRSGDVLMKETLRRMGDDTLARLRKLEATSTEADALAEIVFKTGVLLPKPHLCLLRRENELF